MEELIKEIRKASFNYINQHPAMNLNQEVVRLADIEEIISNRLEKLVSQKTADNKIGFLYELEQKFLELKKIQGGNKWAEGYDEYIAVANLRNFYYTKIQDELASRFSG